MRFFNTSHLIFFAHVVPDSKVHGVDARPPISLTSTLQWRHSVRDCVSNHQCLVCFLNHLFRHRAKKTSKLRVTSLCEGTFPHYWPFVEVIHSQRANRAERWCFHCCQLEKSVEQRVAFPRVKASWRSRDVTVPRRAVPKCRSLPRYGSFYIILHDIIYLHITT